MHNAKNDVLQRSANTRSQYTLAQHTDKKQLDLFCTKFTKYAC